MIERTSAPTGDPYYFKSTAAGECAWYCYYRGLEAFNNYPVYRNRSTKAQGFGDAKNWLVNYREDWCTKDASYSPVPGDIAVFTGTCGHVVFIERVNGDGTALVSQYNMDGYHKFSTATWTIGEILKGKTGRTGKLIGYLHYSTNDNTVSTEYKDLYESAQAKLDAIKEILG